MMISAKKERLHKFLLQYSHEQDWEQAKLEWKLTDVTYNNSTQHCPCSQRIKNVCHITNQITQEVAQIGNDCVLEFIGIDTGRTFDSIKRLIKDPSNSKPNSDLIETAFKCNYIYESEYNFLMSIKNKRKLSYKQQAWLTKINHRILNKTTITH